ncbi:hypothetical protein IC006_0925 [Sulfuracidifex tepidarius]|uniref:Uncharacterized protein n=1 Tax=Sulfuracidifex tepidarius TaxID=1294262 RepID=A0A510DTZ7_9CREN|nr:hypothetical protein IC006_0925 [Sulfuracidifex tepidarius]BBG26384.1 hypothetical protein IC007_0892 [Sulfuracidifex tepidarius]
MRCYNDFASSQTGLPRVFTANVHVNTLFKGRFIRDVSLFIWGYERKTSVRAGVVHLNNPFSGANNFRKEEKCNAMVINLILSEGETFPFNHAEPFHDLVERFVQFPSYLLRPPLV